MVAVKRTLMIEAVDAKGSRHGTDRQA